MAKEIKFRKRITVTIDGEAHTTDDFTEMFKLLNIPTDEGGIWQEVRDNLSRKLLVFHTIDLSTAYKGHAVNVELNEEVTEQ